MNQSQLKRRLKQLELQIRQLNQRLDGAYEIAINDKGAAMDRIQAELDKALEERRKIWEQLL